MEPQSNPQEQTLIEKLRTRAAIRRQIPTRKSVQEQKPDRLAALLDEAADRIEQLETLLGTVKDEIRKI